MPATGNRRQQQSRLQDQRPARAADAGGAPHFGPAKAYRAAVDQGPLQQCRFEQALRVLSPALAVDAYSFANHTPAGCGGGLSPAWSTSSASNNGDSAPPGPRSATYSPHAMFPALTPGSLDVDVSAIADAFVSSGAVGAPADAAAPGPGAPTTADAALDGWLQQFVNADAIDYAAAKRPCAADSPHAVELTASGPLDSLYPGSLAAPVPGLELATTPGDVTPSRSPLDTYMDLLDESTVAAIASAVSNTLPADMLASVFSSASGFCPPAAVASPSASEMGMLAALPFVSITPTANIAPQKTLSVAVPATPELGPPEPTDSPAPLQKKQRLQRPHAPRNSRASAAQPSQAPAGGNAAQFSGGRSPGSNSKAERAPGSRAAATATAAEVSVARPNASSASPSPTQSAGSQAHPGTRAIAPSPPRNARAAGHMVPLAPRSQQAGSVPSQQQAEGAKQQRKTNGSSKSVTPDPSQSTSGSGTSTPPGLSVLAKIAQRQVPISVKVEDPPAATTKTPQQQQQQQQLRPLAQAHSPNARALQKQGQPATPRPAANKFGSPVPRTPATPQQHQQGSANPPESTTQKRQERLIKNRAAALLSRKRKREYMTKLESEVEELRETNSSLAQRLEEMERRLNALTAERDQLRGANAPATSSATAAASSSTTSATATTGGTSPGDTNGAAAAAEPEGGSDTSQQQQQQQPESAHAASDDIAFGDLADAMDTDEMASDMASLADSGSEHAMDSGADEPRIQARVTPPADAPKTREQSANGKQRSAGVLLMAMLFSFSLFTLPALFAPGSQIATGGPQSIGLLPTGALPAAEPRLLIAERSANDRLAAPAAGHNDTTGGRLRPMTMAESASLHSWIKRGLAVGPDHAPAAAGAAQAQAQAQAGKPVDATAPVAQSLSLSVVRQPTPPPPRAEQRDYAMLYCPTMKHLLFGGGNAQQQPPGTARVLGAANAGSSASDVDNDTTHGGGGAQSSPKVERQIADVSLDVADLAPTHAGARHVEPRPKLSFYSPIVAGDGPEVLSPWDENARLSSPSAGGEAAGSDGRQKYLRIDVEVVGSKWVTADKFASGLQ